VASLKPTLAATPSARRPIGAPRQNGLMFRLDVEKASPLSRSTSRGTSSNVGVAHDVETGRQSSKRIVANTLERQHKMVTAVAVRQKTLVILDAAKQRSGIQTRTMKLYLDSWVRASRAPE